MECYVPRQWESVLQQIRASAMDGEGDSSPRDLLL